MPTTQIPFQFPTSKAVERIYAVFNVPRGRPVRLPPGTSPRLAGGKSCPGLVVAADKDGALAANFPNVLAFDVTKNDEGECAFGTLQRVELESLGERLQLAKLVFLYKDGTCEQILGRDVAKGLKAVTACAKPATEKKAASPASGAPAPAPPPALDLTPKTLLTDVDALLAPRENGKGESEDEGKKRRYRAFFSDLDRRCAQELLRSFQSLVQAGTLPTGSGRTDPLSKVKILPLRDSDVETMSMSVANLMRGLESQLRARVGERGDGELLDPSQPFYSVYASHAQMVAYQFLELVKLHFGNGDGTIDFAAFADAFEMFSLGELRIDLASGATCCEPSSGYFFFFGELALFAMNVTEGADETWLKLGTPMIRCQQFFARVYAPPVTVRRPGFLDYGGPQNYRADVAARFRDKGASGTEPSDIEKSRTEFADYTLSDLARTSARNAEDYFPSLLQAIPV